MKTQKTPRARRYLAGLAAGIVAAAVLASFALAMLVLALALVYALLRSSFRENLANLRVKARRDLAQDTLYADGVAHVTARIEGSAPRALRLTIRDTPPAGWTVVQGAPEATAEWGSLPVARYEARPAGRGSWRFGAVALRVRDPYGLFEAHTELSVPLDVRVNPSLESIRRGRAYARKRPFQPRRKDPLGLIFREYEFEGIRSYQGGDRLRDIDWKATTRLQQLMTKVFEREVEGIVYCLVDASRSMREQPVGTRLAMIDHASELVLQVGEIAAQRNFQLGLVVYDELGLVVDVPASRSRGQGRVLAQRVLDIPASLPNVRRLDTSDVAFPPLDAEAAFLSRVRILRGVDTNEAALALGAATTQRPGALEAARRLAALHQPGSLFVFLLSDFATSPDDAAAAALLLRDRGNTVVAGMLSDLRYLEPPQAPVMRDVESAYRAHHARRRARAALKRAGVPVVELDPTTTATDLTEGQA